MLERGTINRDFMLSMQALGFGDEPLSYIESRLRPDSHKWAAAEDIEWDAINSFSSRPGKGDPGPPQRKRAGRNEHKMLSLPKMSAVERQDSCDWGHRPKSL